ncbi:adenosine kinase [Marinoscillum furvescens]|uniref:Sugar/nucleoside kinase (Ribokinase family) n=1 Tax=Marinoscillum furvescens DSM 4134 TaxID=1122208 RepID=A0A3D9KXD2_MARFU|nr:adenosine kinase [Marinoscillum furvescens]RED93597.1 sugar/nucleoside kinase (ribokinase family) [Marinoscillum furvescens DSM 4134]
MSSKKYDVYAIGNALVDYEIEVDDAFLSEHKVEKSLMTLVDEQRQQELIAAVAGHIREKQGGGSAANTIVAVSKLGGKGYYSCKVANDEDGKVYLKDLTDNGLDTNLNIENLPEGITGKCLVMVSPDAERTMNTYLGITSDFSENEIDENALINAEYLFIEGYLVTSETGLAAMKKAKAIAEANGVKVALTFSDPSMVKYFKDQMAEVVGASVDLLFCNEEEAMLYTGTESVEDAREALKKDAKKFVITQGKNGAMIFDGDTFIDIEPYKVTAIDSNGAGDMFSGAFMYGITNGHTMASSGKLASKAASEVVAKYGPRLSPAKLQEIKKEVFDA